MYKIANYDELYRPYDKSGGELKNPQWVKWPCNPKGDGLQNLLSYRKGAEVFAVWGLLLQKTTLEKKPENRGKLLNHRGEPATISEIAKSISFGNRIGFVKYALSVLVEIGWVIIQGESEITSEDFRPTSSKSSVVKSSVLKSNRGKEYTPEFEKFWKNWKGRWNPEKGYIKVGKWLAFEEWEELTDADQQKAVLVAPKASGKYCPDACRWLRDRKFDDYKPPKK